MKPQKVYFLEHKSQIKQWIKSHENVFAPKNLTGWYGWERNWIQRFCFWYLKRIGAFYNEPMEKEVVYKTFQVDTGKFADRVINQMHVLDEYWRMKPKHLLIGVEDYSEIMKQSVDQPFNFNIEYCIGSRKSLFGLTVHVIPWMKGILVMPNEQFLEERKQDESNISGSWQSHRYLGPDLDYTGQ